jgi:hypothetical protein
VRTQKIETMPRHRVLETMRLKSAECPATFERDTVRPAVVACQILDGLIAEVTLAAYVDRDGDPVVCVAFNGPEVRLREMEMRDGLAAAALRASRERDDATAEAKRARARMAEAQRAMLSYCDVGGGW